MKNGKRIALETILRDACGALPSSETLICGSATTMGTACAKLLVRSIENACKEDPALDAEDLARQAAAHPDLPADALRLIEATVEMEFRKPKTIDIAGYPFEIKHYIEPKTPGGWGLFYPSYTEDLLYGYGDAKPAAEPRIAEIVGALGDELVRTLPEVEQPAIRFSEIKGEPAVTCIGWDESCTRRPIEIKLNHACGHQPMAEIRRLLEYRVQAFRRRMLGEPDLRRETDDLMIRVAEAIARTAPDLPFHLRDYAVTEYGTDIRVDLRYDGIGTDLLPTSISSRVKKDADHYLAHVLPGLVNNQRMLHSRIDGSDPRNLLIETPFARLLMNRYGEGWIDQAVRVTHGAVKTEDWEGRVIQGVLRYRFSPAEDVRWEFGELRVPTRLPTTVRMLLRGRGLAEVVEHPYFDAGTLITSASDATTFQGEFLHLRIVTDVPTLRIGDIAGQDRLAA